MFGLCIISIIIACIQAIIKALEPKIPIENYANDDLILKDRINGVSERQIKINAINGKYKILVKYPEPHRNKNGKIIIENYKLYKNDLEEYDSLQVIKWVNQGKYNLSKEEYEKEKKRIAEEFDSTINLMRGKYTI